MLLLLMSIPVQALRRCQQHDVLHHDLKVYPYTAYLFGLRSGDLLRLTFSSTPKLDNVLITDTTDNMVRR
jgi:hypothetical protein